ncbi:hypothetical protein C8J57DRAFT_1254636 [Mycena rebaudengoi]|nr:hypothetical protein C8J57DRAFT_1254636 [Mycena rebaudengoi]
MLSTLPDDLSFHQSTQTDEARLFDTLEDDDPVLNHYLYQGDDCKLFAIALHSSNNWRRIINFLRQHVRPSGLKLGPTIVHSRSILFSLPIELIAEVACCLGLKDLVALAATCKSLHSIVYLHLDLGAHRFTSLYDLDSQEFRFELTMCSALTTGMATTMSLLPFDRLANRRPNCDLLVYVHHTAIKSLEKYMEHGTSYTKSIETDIDLYTPPPRSNMAFVHSNPKKSFVKKRRPICMSFMSGRGAFTAYADTTFRSLALPNPDFLPLDSSSHIQQGSRISAVMARVDFSMIDPHSDPSHLCGSHACCPSTLRTTTDSGTFYFRFLHAVLGRDNGNGIRRAQSTGASWCLGGIGCDDGTPCPGFSSAAHRITAPDSEQNLTPISIPPFFAFPSPTFLMESRVSLKVTQPDNYIDLIHKYPLLVLLDDSHTILFGARS